MIIHRLFAGSVLLFLAGCIATAPPLDKRPTIWTEEDDALYGEILRSDPVGSLMVFCRNYRIGSAGSDPLRPEDYAEYETVFRLAGMNARDLEMIRERSRTFGTGQTFLGLSCSLGNLTDVNRSFYQGLGHQWQVVVGDHSQFIYLEGDGTLTGMIVTGWN